MLHDGAIPDRLGAELAGAKVELHARQVGLVLGAQALDDQGPRVEEQPQRLALAVGRVARPVSSGRFSWSGGSGLRSGRASFGFRSFSQPNSSATGKPIPGQDGISFEHAIGRQPLGRTAGPVDVHRSSARIDQPAERAAVGRGKDQFLATLPDRLVRRDDLDVDVRRAEVGSRISPLSSVSMCSSQ